MVADLYFAIRVWCAQQEHVLASFGWYDDSIGNDGKAIEIPSNNSYAYVDAAQIAIEKVAQMWNGRFTPLFNTDYLYVETRNELGGKGSCWGNLTEARKKLKAIFSTKE